MKFAWQNYELKHDEWRRSQISYCVKNWAFVVITILMIVTVLSIEGCASEPYWKPDRAPVDVEAVYFVSNIQTRCATDVKAYGCIVIKDWNRADIYIDNSLPMDLKICAISHELRGHGEGKSHIYRPVFKVDCAGGYWNPPEQWRPQG